MKSFDLFRKSVHFFIFIFCGIAGVLIFFDILYWMFY